MDDAPKPLLELIRERPTLYLRRKSLTALCDFMTGYESACVQHGQEWGSDLAFARIPPDFRHWVACRTHSFSHAPSVCHMILENSDSEELAFDRFFELIEEYEKRQACIVAKLHCRNILCTKIMSRSGHTTDFPSYISIVTYTNDPGFFIKSEVKGKTFRGWDEMFFSTLNWFESYMPNEWDLLEIVDSVRFARIQAEREPPTDDEP